MFPIRGFRWRWQSAARFWVGCWDRSSCCCRYRCLPCATRPDGNCCLPPRCSRFRMRQISARDFLFPGFPSGPLRWGWLFETHSRRRWRLCWPTRWPVGRPASRSTRIPIPGTSITFPSVPHYGWYPKTRFSPGKPGATCWREWWRRTFRRANASSHSAQL